MAQRVEFLLTHMSDLIESPVSGFAVWGIWEDDWVSLPHLSVCPCSSPLKRKMQILRSTSITMDFSFTELALSYLC